MTSLRRALICGLFLLVPALAGCGADDPARGGQGGRVRRAAAAAQAAPEARRARRRPGRRTPSAVESTGGVAEEPATPKPTGAASGTLERDDAPSAINGGTRNATALDNGVALPPLEAPGEVLKIIEAGNAIARTPYKWGGGHGRFLDTGYDCSGSVSFALYAAGLIDGPSDSGGLMSWGEAGPGKWVTIFSSPGHVYMEVAGIRFDTSGAKRHRLALAERPARPQGGLRRPPPARASSAGPRPGAAPPGRGRARPCA